MAEETQDRSLASAHRAVLRAGAIFAKESFPHKFVAQYFCVCASLIVPSMSHY